MAPTAAAGAMTKITLSFFLSLLGDKNFQGPDAPVNSKYHWAYKGRDGPESWHIHYKYCAGERQSPINVPTSSCEYDPTLEPIILEQFDTLSGPAGPCILNVTNNGHAASVRVLNQDMRVRGGGLGQVYKTVEFHFHWGSTDDVGSEHAVNGRKYPLEMHIVNYAEKYGNVKTAMTQPDGLAVLGVFFEISEKDSPEFSSVAEALRHVHKAGDHSTIKQLRLRSLLPDDLSKFWRYNGSLTTPFCFESVTWTIFAEPQKISKTQLETLRSLLHEEGHDVNNHGGHSSLTPSRLLDNWRPLQPINGRVVKQSFHGEFINTKPFLGTKFETSVSGAPIENRQERLPGTVVYNVNPTYHPAAGQETTKGGATPQERNRMQSHITEMTNFNSQSGLGRGPVEQKLLIYNQGSAGASGINSSPSSDKSHHSEVHSMIGLADGAATDLFGHFQHSPSHGIATHFGPEAIQGKLDEPTSSSSASNSPELYKGGSTAEGNSRVTSSVSRHVPFQQSSAFAKVLKVIHTSTPWPSARVPVSNSPRRVQSPGIQPPLQMVPISQLTRALSAARAGSSQPRTPSLQNQGQQATNHKQKQASPPVSLSNLRTSQMNSHIAALANNIRMHLQHGMAQPTNGNPQLPPVVRHNQPAGQNPSSGLNSQVQPQQPHQQMSQKSPMSQQLRAIFERLAASSQANARTRTLTSGAAVIPRARMQQVNSVGGTSNRNPSPSGSPTVVSNGNRHMPISKGNNPQFQSPSASTPIQSTLTNPNPNIDQNGFATSSRASPQTYGHQPYQQQTGYSQVLPQQQNTHSQQVYPQQSPFQQQPTPTHQYYPPAPYSSGSGASNSNLYYSARQNAPSPRASVVSVPQVSAMDANVQQLFLNSQQQPVRLLRPVYEQVNNWQPDSYQNQQYPFLVS